MSEVDIKGLAKRRQAFEDAALAFAKAFAVRGKSELYVVTSDEAFDDLRNAAFEFVKAMVTGHDGKQVAKGVGEEWRAWIAKNGMLIAAAFDVVKKKPYALIFELAEQNAAKHPKARR